MHFHLPKPLHGWRELVGEVGIIVIGVLIALGAEQVVEAVHWHYKVEATETAIKTELGDDLRWALWIKQTNACATKFIDKIEAAVVANDTVSARKLLDAGGVDDAFPAGAWSSGTYTAALNSQGEDHLPEGLMASYSREFTWVPMQLQFQFEVYEEIATITPVRLGLPVTPDITEGRVAAIERLRSEQRGRVEISEAMLDYAREHLNIGPSNPAYIADNRAHAEQCARRISAI